jgi:GAF domain/PilZ domain
MDVSPESSVTSYGNGYQRGAAIVRAAERRVALRRNVVDTHLVSVDLAFQKGALLLDVSETGVGLQALARAPMGATTELHFDLPETGGRVDAVGTVTWADSSGRMGVRFDDIAEMSRPHLAQWLAREPRKAVAPRPLGGIAGRPVLRGRDEISDVRHDLLAHNIKGDNALAFVLERTRSVTRATGAAIALETEGLIRCRASSGAAPELGARLDPGAGLSGECVRSGEVVRCEDTETDPRADRMVCRKLELRSAVIVPIKAQSRVIGVVEVFSSHAHAFQTQDVLLLRRMAELIAELTTGQTRRPIL